MNLAVLQARMSSTRLPGKVMKNILGKPMLLQQVERILRAISVDKLIIATSKEPEDDDLEKLCLQNRLECYRGSLDDVLDRFYQAAVLYKPCNIIRLTGDCPLIDPAVIDKVVGYHFEGGYDYTSNTIEPTYPDGLDVEVVKYGVLEEAWREAELKSEREHVTLYIHNHSDKFKLGSVKNVNDLSYLRWTVDEPKDFELVSMIYEALYPEKPDFTTQDILEYLAQHPLLMTINNCYERNAGLKKSLAEDRLVKEAIDNE